MPELPLEIWSMIAKYLKREPPPAGRPGNWNDHFHQQDLANMMRVDQVSESLGLVKSLAFWVNAMNHEYR